MSEEDIVEEFYGARDLFEFDISVYYELTGAELREVLHSDADFLHYIGHVDEDGFQCADGMFDARTMETVEVDAFLLNACQSYKQGQALVDRGVSEASSRSPTSATTPQFASGGRSRDC